MCKYIKLLVERFVLNLNSNLPSEVKSKFLKLFCNFSVNMWKRDPDVLVKDLIREMFSKIAEFDQSFVIGKIYEIIDVKVGEQEKEDYNNNNNFSILDSFYKIKLKFYPEEILEESVEFLDAILQCSFDTTNVSNASTSLKNVIISVLTNMRIELPDDVNFFYYQKFNEFLMKINDKFNPIYNTTTTTNGIKEINLRLLCGTVCLSGREIFTFRFEEIVNLLFVKLKDLKGNCRELLQSLDHLLWTYYHIYPEAWATILDQTENLIVKQIFPDGRRTVGSAEDGGTGGIDEIVDLIDTILNKLPRFGLNEIIKKILKQLMAVNIKSTTVDTFPWIRANILLQSFLRLCKMLSEDGENDPFKKRAANHLRDGEGKTDKFKWRNEYKKLKIEDQEIESIFTQISELIAMIIELIQTHCWSPHSNTLQLDTNKKRMMSVLELIIEAYDELVGNEFLLRLCYCENQIEVISSRAVELAKKRMSREYDNLKIKYQLQIHEISRILFNQTSDEASDFLVLNLNPLELSVVYKFIRCAFDGKEKGAGIVEMQLTGESSSPLLDDEILKGTIFYLLEALEMWSQVKLSESTVRIDSVDEINHFGRIIEIYFILLWNYESLIKAVYVEKQNSGKNIIMRSWVSSVGFKRKSKEMADFLVSLLGYSEERLRMRLIEAFQYIPVNKVTDFMKLLERFRLPISDDLVNLRRRTNSNLERGKIEITRVYRNVLRSALKQKHNLNEIVEGTAIKIILRHVVELFYYCTKMDSIDKFRVKDSRREFVGLLGEYVKVVNVITIATTVLDVKARSALFPYKFQFEVWQSVNSWYDLHEERESDPDSDFGDNLNVQNCFIELSCLIVTAAHSVGKISDSFINEIFERSRRVGSDRLSDFVYNLLKIEEDPLFERVVDRITLEMTSSDKNVQEVDTIKEGVLRALKEDRGVGVERERDRSVSLSLKFFRFVNDIPVKFTDEELNEVLGVRVRTIRSGRIQRKILIKIGDIFEFGVNVTVTNRIDDKSLLSVLEGLFLITMVFKETFPGEIARIWKCLIEAKKQESSAECEKKNNNNLSVIIHFLQENYQKTMIHEEMEVGVFILRAVDRREEIVKILLKYAHPYTGTSKKRVGFENSPVKVSLLLLKGTGFDNFERNQRLKVLKRLSDILLLDIESECSTVSCDDMIDNDYYYDEMLEWASGCPNKTACKFAWREIFKMGSFSGISMSDELIEKRLLPLISKFLKHLVCPETFYYFDPELVADIIDGLRGIILGRNVSDECLKGIFSIGFDQMGTKDEVVYDAAVELLKSCFEFTETWDYISLCLESGFESMSMSSKKRIVDCSSQLHYEIIKRPTSDDKKKNNNNNFMFLFSLLSIECGNFNFCECRKYFINRPIEKYLCYFLGIIPKLIEFNEQPSIEQQSDAQVEVFFEYVNLLIIAVDKIILTESPETIPNLLQVRSFLVSVEGRRRRQPEDFYKTLGGLMAKIPGNWKFVSEFLAVNGNMRRFYEFTVNYLKEQEQQFYFKDSKSDGGVNIVIVEKICLNLIDSSGSWTIEEEVLNILSLLSLS